MDVRQFFRPTIAPEWLGEVLSSIRGALSDVWPTPIRAVDYSTANLPPAADWKQGIAYDTTAVALKYSDGASWIRLSDYDADVAAIAALSTTGLIARTGAGTAAIRAVTGTANQITVTNGDGVAGNPTISLPSAITFPGSIAATSTVATGTYTVAGLPAAGTTGRTAFVTDANATTFASIVAGGGANRVPVYDDGTNWRIG